jgi:hypothetical protein
VNLGLDQFFMLHLTRLISPAKNAVENTGDLRFMRPAFSIADAIPFPKVQSWDSQSRDARVSEPASLGDCAFIVLMKKGIFFYKL